MATTALRTEHWAIALQKANHVRITNAETSKRLAKAPCKADGLEAAAELLRHTGMDEPLGTMPIRRFLGSIRGVGDSVRSELMRRTGVYDDRPLRRLSLRQRLTLAELMDEGAAAARRRMAYDGRL